MLYCNILILKINISLISYLGIIVNCKRVIIPKIWELSPIGDWRIVCWLITLHIALWCSLIMVYLWFLSIIFSKIRSYLAYLNGSSKLWSKTMSEMQLKDLSSGINISKMITIQKRFSLHIMKIHSYDTKNCSFFVCFVYL